MIRHRRLVFTPVEGPFVTLSIMAKFSNILLMCRSVLKRVASATMCFTNAVSKEDIFNTTVGKFTSTWKHPQTGWGWSLTTQSKIWLSVEEESSTRKLAKLLSCTLIEKLKTTPAPCEKGSATPYKETVGRNFISEEKEDSPGLGGLDAVPAKWSGRPPLRWKDPVEKDEVLLGISNLRQKANRRNEWRNRI